MKQLGYSFHLAILQACMNLEKVGVLLGNLLDISILGPDEPGERCICLRTPIYVLSAESDPWNG